MAILQQQLPELEAQFPELAKHVKDANPVPVVAPAALLHDAQAACQKAFKELSQAESKASEIEDDAAELVATLHQKVEDLREAQGKVAIARGKYDEAAKIAQLQVQRARPIGTGEQEKEHIVEPMATLQSHQLEEVASALVLAAKSARQSGPQPQACTTEETT